MKCTLSLEGVQVVPEGVCWFSLLQDAQVAEFLHLRFLRLPLPHRDHHLYKHIWSSTSQVSPQCWNCGKWCRPISLKLARNKPRTTVLCWTKDTWAAFTEMYWTLTDKDLWSGKSPKIPPPKWDRCSSWPWLLGCWLGVCPERRWGGRSLHPSKPLAHPEETETEKQTLMRPRTNNHHSCSSVVWCNHHK